MKPIDELFTGIAREHLGIETLETRNLDSLDFHDVSVAGVRDALRAAYQAGLDDRPARMNRDRVTADSGHAPEPWTESGMAIIQDASGAIVADCDSPDLPAAMHRVNGCRIVAAVNACKGLSTPELERGILRDLFELANQVVLAKDTEESVPVKLYAAAVRVIDRCQS
jgi:hypothetical protein